MVRVELCEGLPDYTGRPTLTFVVSGTPLSQEDHVQLYVLRSSAERAWSLWLVHNWQGPIQ